MESERDFSMPIKDCDSRIRQSALAGFAIGCFLSVLISAFHIGPGILYVFVTLLGWKLTSVLSGNADGAIGFLFTTAAAAVIHGIILAVWLAIAAWVSNGISDRNFKIVCAVVLGIFVLLMMVVLGVELP